MIVVTRFFIKKGLLVGIKNSIAYFFPFHTEDEIGNDLITEECADGNYIRCFMIQPVIAAIHRTQVSYKATDAYSRNSTDESDAFTPAEVPTEFPYYTDKDIEQVDIPFTEK
jgi:hypothetical protein